MSKIKWLVIMVSILTMFCCGSGEDQNSEAVLNLFGLNGETKSLSFEDLQNLQTTTGYGGWITSVGTIHEPVVYTGISVIDLLSQVGGLSKGQAVQITATDDYSMNLSYEQVAEGGLPVFNALTGDETDYQENYSVIIAYEKDGLEISEDDGGPLRIAIVSEKADQITDGHWWIKQVRDLAIVAGEEDYTLKLEGPHTEDVDKNTFESGTASGCHGTEYVDDQANSWTGIPLWLLVGYMDDENVHEGKAFNRELVEAGYTVIIHDKDGNTVELDAKKVAENNDIIVANKKNDVSLGDKFFPLRLVGSDLAEDQMIGQIVKISMTMD